MLSIEEKAKRYDEAIEKLRNAFYDNNSRMCDEYRDACKRIIEPIFPELKESKDERIRNFISNELACLRATDSKGSDRYEELTNAIAWLEKQGEKEFIVVIPKFRVGDVIRPKGSTEEYTIESISGECYYGKGCGLHISCDNDYELVEQKPADKVEPKFKVGDWIITNKKHIWYVDETPETTSYLYRLINQYGKVEVAEFEVVDEKAKLWTIQDAKDGDVLADSYGVYIFDKFDDLDSRCYFCKGAFQYSQKDFEEDSMLCSKEFVRPATQKERNLLFQKMHEADYEWDAEKKELKKIEQKPAWSEEDESKRKFIEDELSGLIADEIDIESPLTKRAKDLYSALYWLKSLRPQSQWKPSDEQMEAVEHFIVYHNGSTNYAKDLEELRLQLKKLREE